MIYNKVLEKGYDMTKEPIPIYPCQHYLMGGINVDGKGATNIHGLYEARGASSRRSGSYLCIKRCLLQLSR